MLTVQVASTRSKLKAERTSLQTLIVATDFSENATSALNSAIELARAQNAKIILVHAVDTELPALAGADQPLSRFVRQNMTALEGLVRAAGIRVHAEHHFGKPWIIIPKVARDAKADLVVLGNHGASKMGDRFLGTVADRIIKMCSVPVLVIRKQAAHFAQGVRTILVAADFSEESALATSAAVRILQGCPSPGRLVLFHTIALPINYLEADAPLPMPQHWDEAEQVAASRLESLAASLRNDQFTISTKIFRGYPAEGILHEAQTINADIIAMGTQGRTGLNRFMMGSVAERVLHHAQCPVLTVRKPDADEPVRLSAE